MLKVVFINGKPRAGKDTFCEIADHIARRSHKTTLSVSSIDPIRGVFMDLNLYDKKTPELRAAMAEVGTTLERYFNFRTNHVMAILADVARWSDLVFVHVREPELIAKWAAIPWFQSIKLYVSSTRAEDVTSNEADAGTWRDNFYDHVVENNGTIQEYRETVLSFLKKIELISEAEASRVLL